MSDFRADLHCHSTCSDGTLQPLDLVRHAKERGLQGLSITDHDSIDAYRTIMPLAQELGVEIISGVEFSSAMGDISVHILSYAFPLESPIIHTFCEQHNIMRDNRNREILGLLSKHGMPVTEEEIEAAAPPNAPEALRTVGRPHIAQAMINKGYVGSLREAFNKYLGEGKSCYSPGKYFSPEETIDVIHQAKGLAVIAHPHLVDHSETILKLLKMDFDGIECYYSRFAPKDNSRWLKIAERKKWLVTGGSDFHGAVKPGVELGCSWVPEEPFRILQRHFLENA